ncbi:cellulose synthase, partial [Photobacterium damselae]
IDYIQCTFARADIWAKWQQSYQADKPLSSMSAVLQVGLDGYKRLFMHSPAPVVFCVSIFVVIVKFLWSLRPRYISSRSLQHAN